MKLRCGACGRPLDEILWLLDGRPILGGDEERMLPGSITDDGITYRCGGCLMSHSVWLADVADAARRAQHTGRADIWAGPGGCRTRGPAGPRIPRRSI